MRVTEIKLAAVPLTALGLFAALAGLLGEATGVAALAPPLPPLIELDAFETQPGISTRHNVMTDMCHGCNDQATWSRRKRSLGTGSSKVSKDNPYNFDAGFDLSEWEHVKVTERLMGNLNCGGIGCTYAAFFKRDKMWKRKSKKDALLAKRGEKEGTEHPRRPVSGLSKSLSQIETASKKAQEAELKAALRFFHEQGHLTTKEQKNK